MIKEELIAILTSLPDNAELVVYCPHNGKVLPSVALFKTGKTEYIITSVDAIKLTHAPAVRDILP